MVVTQECKRCGKLFELEAYDNDINDMVKDMKEHSRIMHGVRKYD